MWISLNRAICNATTYNAQLHGYTRFTPTILETKKIRSSTFKLIWRLTCSKIYILMLPTPLAVLSALYKLNYSQGDQSHPF